MRLAGHRHLLLLHGIHARQAADHLLIQLNRLNVFLQLLQLRLQFTLEKAKVRLQLGALCRSKFFLPGHPLPAQGFANEGDR